MGPLISLTSSFLLFVVFNLVPNGVTEFAVSSGPQTVSYVMTRDGKWHTKEKDTIILRHLCLGRNGEELIDEYTIALKPSKIPDVGNNNK